MKNLFAHAEELHTESTSEIEHAVTELPVFVIVVVIVGVLLAVLLKVLRASKSTVALTAMGYLLVSGILAYTFAPALGAIFVALGVTLALVFTLTGIAAESRE